VWQLILRLEASGLAEHSEFLGLLFFRLWPVFREPCLLWEQSSWAWNNKAHEYVKCLFPEYATSLPLENTYNDLRDNEQRGARHLQRSDVALQALSISSLASRDPHARQIRPREEDIARYFEVQLYFQTQGWSGITPFHTTQQNNTAAGKRQHTHENTLKSYDLQSTSM
jgi:hypothetical protein